MKWVALGMALLAAVALWFASRGGDGGGNAGLDDAKVRRVEEAPLLSPEGSGASTERQVTDVLQAQDDVPAAPPAVVPELVVRVLDAAGQAVEGERVYFLRRTPNGGGGLAPQTSDARGEVRFAIRPEWRESANEPIENVVLVESPFGAGTERVLDLAALPAEPIELRLKDGGLLELEIFDPLGERTALPCTIELGVVSEPGKPAPSWLASFHMQDQMRSSAGRWKSPLLAFDRTWRLAIEPQGGSHLQTYVEVVGPTASQRIVTARATLGVAKPILHARLLDPQGQPLADQDWAGVFERRGDCENLSNTRSDGAGKLSWPLPPTSMRVTSGALWLWSPVQEPRWLARVSLPVPLAAGVIELGDLQIEELSFGAQGIVVDPAGQPVSDVRIELQGTPTTNATPDALLGRWATTDAEGRFAFRVPEFLPRFSLRVPAGRYPEAKLEDLERATPASMNLRIALTASGEITGSVLLEEERARAHWRIELVDDRGRRIEQNFLEARGFGFHALPAGRSYTLRFGISCETVEQLRSNSSGQLLVLHELADFRIPERGGACDDARLREVDLRGRTLLREFLVVDETGRPFAQRSFGLAMRGTDGVLRSAEMSTDSAGRAEWLGPHDLRELHLGVQGYAIAAPEPNLASQRVELRRGLPVVIELAPGAPEIPAGFEIWPSLRHQALPELWIAAFGQEYLDFEAPVRDGRAEIFVAGPGTYSVSWMLRRQVGGSLGGTPADVPRRDLIEVLDATGPQRFTKAPHRDGVAAALRSFEGR